MNKYELNEIKCAHTVSAGFISAVQMLQIDTDKQPVAKFLGCSCPVT